MEFDGGSLLDKGGERDVIGGGGCGGGVDGVAGGGLETVGGGVWGGGDGAGGVLGSGGLALGCVGGEVGGGEEACGGELVEDGGGVPFKGGGVAEGGEFGDGDTVAITTVPNQATSNHITEFKLSLAFHQVLPIPVRKARFRSKHTHQFQEITPK